MTNLLVRLFVKNYEEISDKSVRESYGVLSGSVGIALNVLLSLIKLCAGIISASVSVTADAMNNLSDALSSVITLIGFKMSGKPADRRHPFGHGRIEYVSALFVSLAIILMGFELAKSSVEKIACAEQLVFSPVSAAILVVSILIKLWMYLFNRKIGKKIDSQSVLAASKDSLSDSAATLAVLLGMLFFRFTGFSIDGYIGLVVSCFILFAGYQTIRDALSPLLGQPPSKELVEDIKNTVMSHEGIIGMHDLIIHNYGPTRFMLSLHAEVSANDDVIKLHDTIDLIEKQLQTRYKCDAVIHMDPIEVDNEVILQTKRLVEGIVADIDPTLSIHDFRMVTGATHTNLIFDLVVPFDYSMSDGELSELVQSRVSEANSSCFTVINIDKNYV